MDWWYSGIHDYGTLGALAGFALGSLLDGNNGLFWQYIRKKDRWKLETMMKASGIVFLFSMLVMASYIIRADGRIMHSEMEYVRQFLRMNFGEEASSKENRFC